MIIIKYDYILLLLLFICLFRINNGYQVVDITPGDSFLKLYKPGFACYFTRTYLCIETEDGDNCDTLQIDFGTTGPAQALLAKNDTASIVQVTFSGSVTATYTGNINSVLPLEFECMDIDLDALSLKEKEDYFKVFNYGNMGFITTGLYELEGIDPSNKYNGALSYLSANDPTFTVFVQNIPFSTKYLSQITQSIPTKYNISNMEVTMNTGTKTKTFPLEPIGKNLFDQIYDIKTYPDIEYLSTMTLMGIHSDAILSFKSNNTAFKSFYSININDDSANTQNSAVGGDENSTTYYYALSNYGENFYDLFYISDAQFVNSSKRIHTNYSSYSTGQYIYSSISIYSYTNNLPIATYGFSDVKSIQFSPLQITLDDNNQQISSIKFPFGFSYVSPTGYKFNATSMVRSYVRAKSEIKISIASDYGLQFNQLSAPFKTPITYDPDLTPSLIGYEAIRLFDDTYLFRIKVKAPYGLNYFDVIQAKQFFGKEALVSGDLYDGVYEFVSLATADVSIKIVDIYSGEASIASGTYFKAIDQSLQLYITPSFVPNLNVYSIYNVSFLYNNIDVTNRRHYNVMYFNFTSDIPRNLPVVLIPIDYGLLADATIPLVGSGTDDVFYAEYDESIQMFKVEFFVPENSKIGAYPFTLVAALKLIYSQVLDSQLIIKKSGMDFLGPKFKQIKKIVPSSSVDSNNKFGILGWSFEIEDPVNGFESGYIIISGEIDKSIYNISINANDVKPGGNSYLGEYDININISYPCISQNYIITEVSLYDRLKRKSSFSIFPLYPDYAQYVGIMNPFMYYLNDSSINKIPLTCAVDPIASADTTPPVLSSFSLSKQVIDVSATNRQISFTFTATDLESGIKNHQYPSVYLNTLNNRFLESKSSIVSINKTSATYSCTVQLPISFGFPDNIILSVYNFVNNNGYSSGYSTTQLFESNLPYYLNTTFDTNEPSIIQHYRFRSTGGNLFLYGRAFDVTSQVNIIFNDGTTSLADSIVISSTVIKVQNVKATDKPFKVYIKTSTFTSNTITVTPVIFDSYVPEPTFPPTLTPVPTNSPQSCPGTPVCGGPSNGKCIQNQGCVCYSPWLGLDCLSQIIVVNPPIINTGNNSNSGSGSDDSGTGSPSIEIIVPGTINNNTNNNGNNNTTPITYSSLISIIALREIDINGGVVKTHTFKENWLSKQIDTLTYAFYTSIENEDSSPTNVTAILKWFTNKTIISFANEELTMNPSSMKYTIEIGNYPFSSALNQLQLVMSALIQSNTTDNVCSVKEFGETTSGDNSNYVKIQVDNHSLFGRFIRRGIVDSNIRTITNVLLDKDMNPITTTKSLQSYIGINVPNYKESVIIDPDFSVVLDSYSASSKSNSICSTKSKLSAGKIAGIALGATAFAAVLVISLTYYLKRKNDDRKFMSSVNKKMSQVNKS